MEFYSMAFIKFKGEQLFDGYHLLNDKVLICSEEGEVIDLVDSADAGEEVNELEGIISPGFINCHCHLELSHMKGRIMEESGLVDFVYGIITQRHSSMEEMLDAIDKAETEMLDQGIVAVGDICNNNITAAQKQKGRLYYHNFIEASGVLPELAPVRFQHSVDLFREFSLQYSIPVESNSIVPHAPYSVSTELWESIIHFPGNHLFSIHNQETEAENEWFRNKSGEFNRLYSQINVDTSSFQPTGKSSLRSYLPRFLRNQSLILVHNVHTHEDDLQFSKTFSSDNEISWCLCPNANWYISRKIPPLDSLMQNDCRIVLGTDSLASNYQLSIMAEISRLQEHFPHVSLETMLRWATTNGAKALQLDQLMGSFEKGKRPGVVVIKDGNAMRIL